jgi:hypothetical protein
LENGPESLSAVIFRNANIMVCCTPLEPTQSAFERIFRGCPLRLPRYDVVQCHCDVGTQRPLDIDSLFGREFSAASVHVRLEFYAVFVDLAEAFEREDLKTSRICQKRMRPGHEFVEAAQCRNHFFAWANVQVICVGQDDSSSGCRKIVW